MAAPPPPSSSSLASSIDAIVNHHAKKLKPGQTLKFTLLKGATTRTEDRNGVVEGAASAGESKKGTLVFPRMAKFPVSVVPPIFFDEAQGQVVGSGIAPLNQNNNSRPPPTNEAPCRRLYERDVPEAKDEGEGDGDDDRDGSGANGAGGAGGADGAPPKRKRRWGANQGPRRQWILENEEEFTRSRDPNAVHAHATSITHGNVTDILQRYEGMPEFNSSHYALFSVHPSSSPNQPVIAVTPAHGFHAFHQPSKVHTLSMAEAEEIISDQRASATRYMMHARSKPPGSDPSKSAPVLPNNPRHTSQEQQEKGAMVRARLMGRVKANNADGSDDDDDVMGDVSFQKRDRGRSARARKELLEDLGDGLTVDDDGVLGGANDGAFGGKRGFARLAAPSRKGDKAAGDGDDSGGKKPRGGGTAATFDGLAMADDFYQRDVGAEYEDLDFDANEQFDDDDVDQMEEVVASSGRTGDVEDDDFDDDDGDDSGGGRGGDGAGLASSAGLKQLMAKARGEQVGEDGDKNAAGAQGDSKGVSTAYKRDEPGAAASEATTNGAPNGTKKETTPTPGAGGSPDAAAPPTKRPRAGGSNPVPSDEDGGVGVDEQGNRIISLEAIRREIWLHHGQIKMKRLLKIFNISKKNTSQTRQNKFRDLIKELCTMKQTVEGNFLVLKQHYANL